MRDPPRAAHVLARLLEAHGLATVALRARDRTDADGDGAATRIGLAHNVRVFDAASSHPFDGYVARVADRFCNLAVTDAVAKGRIHISLPTSVTIDQPAPALRGSLDWLGINYYTRDFVRARLPRAARRGPALRHGRRSRAPPQRHGLGKLQILQNRNGTIIDQVAGPYGSSDRLVCGSVVQRVGTDLFGEVNHAGLSYHRPLSRPRSSLNWSSITYDAVTTKRALNGIKKQLDNGRR